MSEMLELPPGDKLLSDRDSAKKFAVSPTTWWRMEREAAAAGRWFPQKFQISRGRVGRLESELDRMLGEIVAAQRDDAA